MRYARRGNASADYHAVDSRPFESAFLLKRYDWSSSHCLRVGSESDVGRARAGFLDIATVSLLGLDLRAAFDM